MPDDEPPGKKCTPVGDSPRCLLCFLPGYDLFCGRRRACSARCFLFSIRKVFGFEVPAEVPGVPAKVLNPREAWSDKESYDATRTKLAGMFKENFTKFVKVGRVLSLHLFLSFEIYISFLVVRGPFIIVSFPCSRSCPVDWVRVARRVF